MKTEQLILGQIERFTVVIDRCDDEDRERWLLSMKQLIRAGKVSEWIHVSGLRYWTARSPRPLSAKALVRSLAVFCFCESSERSLLGKRDIERYFPNLFRHGLARNHYINRNPDEIRMGHVRADTGELKINRICHYTDRLIHKYRAESGFRTLIDEGRFELTWIVATQFKQRRLRESLQQFSGSGIRICVYAIPHLLNVITPITDDDVDLPQSLSRV